MNVELPQCKHRHATIDGNVFACASPFVFAPYGVEKRHCDSCVLADLDVYTGDKQAIQREGFTNPSPPARHGDGRKKLQRCRHRARALRGADGRPLMREPP